jgi:hypothetical protein
LSEYLYYHEIILQTSISTNTRRIHKIHNNYINYRHNVIQIQGYTLEKSSLANEKLYKFFPLALLHVLKFAKLG